jgi:uncharacterized protein with HEPN domain
MSDRVASVLLRDMLEALDRIQSYTAGMTYEQFVQDRKTVDAVLRNLSVLGEAANRMPASVRDQASDIEWVRIIRSRHIVVHNYFGVDEQIVWRIIQMHLPPLREALGGLLDEDQG